MATPCPVCGANRTYLWRRGTVDRALRPEDLKITDDRYGQTLPLYRCPDCSFVFAGVSEVGRLAELYGDLVDEAYVQTSGARARQMQWLLQHGLRMNPRAQTLLDLGAANGLLVAEAARCGLKAVGLEPSRFLVDSARQRQASVLEGSLPHPMVQGPFDLVYLVDVIEHTGDPVRMLADCASVLASDGTLFVVTPDISSAAARWLGRRWWHYRLAHVGYFSRQSMTEAARRAGLAIQVAMRSRWSFSGRYLLERAAAYPSLRFVRPPARPVPMLAGLLDRTFTINFHDSYAFAMTRKG